MKGMFLQRLKSGLFSRKRNYRTLNKKRERTLVQILISHSPLCSPLLLPPPTPHPPPLTPHTHPFQERSMKQTYFDLHRLQRFDRYTRDGSRISAAIRLKNNKNFGPYIRAIFCSNCYHNFSLCGIFEKMTSFAPILNQSLGTRKNNSGLKFSEIKVQKT